MNDWADPNTWDLSSKLCRVYGDDNCNVVALVDEEDYPFLIRHRWNPKRDSRGKMYLRRAVSTYDEEGSRLGSATVYLHVEVMKRTGIAPPCSAHLLVDHRDGDSMHCWRSNLRWATFTMNNRNRFGQAALQEELV